jgi:hypothetical protein
MRLLSLVAVCATALTSLPLSTPAAAVPREDNRDIKSTCETLLRNDYAGFPISLGECIAEERASPEGHKTKICRFLLETGQFPAEGYSDYSTCVRIYPETEFPPQ